MIMIRSQNKLVIALITYFYTVFTLKNTIKKIYSHKKNDSINENNK